MFRESQVKNIDEANLGYAREINTAEGKYFLIFGFHDKQQVVPENVKDFSACTLETGGNAWTSNKELEETIETLRYHRQYRALVESLNKNGIPIILADPESKENLHILSEIDSSLITQCIRIIASLGLGGYLAEEAENLLQRKKITRRDLLKFTVGGTAMLKASQPLLAYGVGKMHHEETIGHEASSAMTKTSEILNPELHLIVLTFRNAVIAYKERYLMREKAKNRINGRNFNMATVMGEAHTGIESIIKLSDKSLLNIIKTLKPLAVKFCGKESIWRIAECSPKKVQIKEELNGMATHYIGYDYDFKITEVPELKQIFAN